LQKLQEDLGLTYLFITHDREEALRTGHRIGVLNHGRLEQIATPEEIYRFPKTAFVASFLGKINWLRGEVTSDGGRPAVNICGSRVPLDGRSPAANGPLKVGIRPEDLWITPQARSASEGLNGRLSAMVMNRLFFGDSTTIRVAVADGTELVVDQRPVSDALPGQTVQIEWSPAAMHVFPAGEETAPIEATK
jgi:ABC-type Fe3+/spermidine/putrescine transport system ATPase subunit